MALTAIDHSPGGAQDLVRGDTPTRGLIVAHGRSLEWHEAGYGRFVEAAPQVFASREVESIAGAEEIDVRGSLTVWAAMRQTAFALVSGAAFLPGVDALELRYVAEPRQSEQTRLRMYITAKSVFGDAGSVQAAVEAACAALPRGFTWGAPEDPHPLAGRGWASDTVVELHRLEEITGPQWSFIPTQFYYTINDDPGDASGWPAFWALFAKISRPVEISLLFRGTDLDPQERNTLARITSDLSLYGHEHTDYDVFGNQMAYPADTNALVAYENWSRRVRQLQRPVLARIAVRGTPEAAFPIATALATAIGASTNEDGTSQPMYLESPDVGTEDERLAFEAYDWLEIFPWGGAGLWSMDEAPRVLRRLPYLYGLDEAAGLAVLPVPDEQGVPGFPRARRAAGRRASVSVTEPDSPGVSLGDVLHHGELAGAVTLPLAAINRHVLIVGASGSGKTTTVHTILVELWRDHRIPFLVVEPIKKEYRSLLETPGMAELNVITLGRDDISPMRLNPLAPPPGVRREVHTGGVMSALKMALPLFPPLPQLLEDALDRTYEMAGWSCDTTLDEDLMPPTLRSLLERFEEVFESEGYVGEARNIAAAFRVRLKSLLRGSRGRVLDTVESIDFDQLMARPTIIELDEVPDADDKAVLAAFLLDRVRAAARARGSTAGKLRHVTVIEEAHRLLARDQEGTADAVGSDNTRANAVRAFCEAIRELRAQGQGFVLSSQSPADLARAAVATTGTRIVHRLETASDRDVVLDDIDASPLDRDAAARLGQGEAVVRWPEQDDAELLQVRPATGIDSGRNVADGSVGDHMALSAAAVKALLPYPLCTRSVCTRGCEPDIRGDGQSIAIQVGAEARKIWGDSQGRVDALQPIAAILAADADGDRQRAYCAAVHLAVAGDAFNIRRRVDIRPQLADAINTAVGDQ